MRERQTIWARARDDTDRFRETGRWFWGWEIVGVAVSTAIGYMLTPEHASKFEEAAYPAAGLIVGAVVVYALIYLWNVFWAAARQRNEAWDELDKIPGSVASPITAQATVFIDASDDADLVVPQAILAGPGSTMDSAGKKVERGILLSATHSVLVEQVELEIAGTRAASSWKSDWLAVGVPTMAHLPFAIPEDVSVGEHNARVVAYADNQWWASNYVPFTVPPTQLEDAPES